MAKKIYGLIQKDVGRLERCIRWFEQGGRNPNVNQRRRKPVMAGAGMILRWAKTQELSKDVTDQYISVKLLDPNSPTGTETGEAFDATCIFTDAATAANQCLPVVPAGKAILIAQIGTTWYIVNPSFIKKTVC